MYRDEVPKALYEIIKARKEEKGILSWYHLYRLRLYRFWVASSSSGFENARGDRLSREIKQSFLAYLILLTALGMAAFFLFY